MIPIPKNSVASIQRRSQHASLSARTVLQTVETMVGILNSVLVVLVFGMVKGGSVCREQMDQISLFCQRWIRL